MPLMQSRAHYKPFEYLWAYDAWLTQQRLHWLPEEISMADDVKDWKMAITPSEKNLLTQVFRFFTQADTEVHNCYIHGYAGLFKVPEISMMLSAFANMESIHMAAYSYLLDTLGVPEVEYQAFLKYKEMKDKYDYMQQFNCSTHQGVALTLAAFGAFTEGLQLFASFAILLNFQRFGKMRGMGQIVAWSARDETLHTLSIIRLFHTFMHEHPELQNEHMQRELINVCKAIVEHEDAFIDLAFEMGPIEGLTADEVKLYIRFIANRRLSQLGLTEIYVVPTNPLPWLDEILNGTEFCNFFETKATEYSKAATSGVWDEAF